jgi:hypothetical protein
MHQIMVYAWQDRMGNVLVRPVSDKWAHAFCRAVAKNGGPSMEEAARDNYTVFIQEGMGASEFLEECTSRQRQDIEGGWHVTFKADPWWIGNLYGYDACGVV